VRPDKCTAFQGLSAIQAYAAPVPAAPGQSPHTRSGSGPAVVPVLGAALSGRRMRNREQLAERERSERTRRTELPARFANRRLDIVFPDTGVEPRTEQAREPGADHFRSDRRRFCT
jgi:hypothetical protein